MTGPERYDRLVLPFIHPFTRALLGRMTSLRPNLVLDHGAGTGEVTLTIHRRWPRARIVALDPSREMLDRLVAKAGGGHDWLAIHSGTLADAGFVGRFDLCTSQMVLMFVPDPADELARLRRAATPSGQLAVTVLEHAETMLPFFAYWTAVERVAGGAAPSSYPHHRFADGEQFRKLVEGAGWRNVAVHAVSTTRVLGADTLWRWVSTTLPIRSAAGDQIDRANLPAVVHTAIRREMLAIVEPYRVGRSYRLPISGWLLTAASSP